MPWRIAALALTLTTALTAVVDAAGPYVPPVVPTNIAVTDRKLVLVGHAFGTQNYICSVAATASGVDWFFLGPQATLFDSDGRQIATHFLSKNPISGDFHATWQHSTDTSAVWAKKLRGSTESDFVAPGAIEWLLLEVTGNRVGPFGGLKLAKVTRIQRVNTVGGVKPPADECTPSTINARQLVPYEADYYFYE
jgi:hypothetical protein